MIRQYDAFKYSGSLSLKAFWTILSGLFVASSGSAEVTAPLNTDALVVHQTDANLSLPASFKVFADIQIEGGSKFAGFVLLCDSSGTPSTRVEFRWTEDFGQQFQLFLPGLGNFQSALAPGFFDYSQPNAIHRFELDCEFVGLNGGKPTYIFRATVDDQQVLVSPPRVLNYWTSTMHHFGLVGRREGFLVASPVLRFHTFGVDDYEVHNGDPAPVFEVDITRTPIVVLDEKPIASPVAFPYSIGLTNVEVFASVRSFKNKMGYNVTHPRLSAARQFYGCTWVGNTTDKDGVMAFHEARRANHDNFTATINIAAIGTKDVAFAEDTIIPVVLGPDLWAIEFGLVELL